MHIGFTGTQKGMTVKQLEDLKVILSELNLTDTIHHGDCIGADAELHKLCSNMIVPVILHPPTDPSKRAFCSGICLLPKPYLTRNKDIVNSSDYLIAAPNTAKETLRSGTWSTIRYARKLGKRVVILQP